MGEEDLTLKAIGEKLTRARSLIRCMEEAAKSAQDNFNYLEIGCCFQEVEGMSTFVAAKFIAERYKGNGHVFSLDIDPQHIADSAKIVERYEPSLLSLIKWIEGSSLGTLPRALEAVDQLHFAFVDGGAGPAENLFEFLAIWAKLADGGVIVVDDCTFLKPSAGYAGRRDFGKAQMILPFLMTIEHLNFVKGVIQDRTGKDDAEAQIESMLQIPSLSSFTEGLYTSRKFHAIADEFKDMDFVFSGSQLIVGNVKTISAIRGGEETNRVVI